MATLVTIDDFRFADTQGPFKTPKNKGLVQSSR